MQRLEPQATTAHRQIVSKVAQVSEKNVARPEASRGEPPERLQDLIAEAIANCWVTFVPLMNRGLQDAIYAMPLGEVSCFCTAKFRRQMRQKKKRTPTTIRGRPFWLFLATFFPSAAGFAC